MISCEFRRQKRFSLYKYLILIILALSGTFLIKFTQNPCRLEDIVDGKNSVRSQICRDEIFRVFRLGPEEHSELNCSNIIKGDPEAIKKATHIRDVIKKEKLYLNEQMYLKLTADCKHFREFRKYITIPMSKEEENYPIAYSMVIHENIEMFERLLRAIYAPQNIYCIHVDEKSSMQFKEAVKGITSCFDNVFVASKLVPVIYAAWSLVQADLNCMEDLLQSKIQWRYRLNTCGADFPLKTNAEIVRSLKTLNGKNSAGSERPTQMKIRRWKYHHEVSDHISETKIEKTPPPIESPMFTGNTFTALSRDFIEYIFKEPRVLKFIDWAKDTTCAEEHLWATLNRMPGVPGSSPFHVKYDKTDMNAITRMIKWAYYEGDVSKGAAYPPCTGIYRRSVCVYGAGDLSWIIRQHHLLANKFDQKVDDTAVQCLEEYIRYKTLSQDHL